MFARYPDYSVIVSRFAYAMKAALQTLGMSQRILMVLVGTFALLASNPAIASDFDIFGVNPIGIAEASSRVAGADDGSASYYNPGGLALGEGYKLDVSANGMLSEISAQSERASIDDPYGGTMTVAADVPLKGVLKDRIRFGVATHAMTSGLMRVKLRKSVDPFFPYYDNRTQRIVVIPALSARIANGLGVGVSVNALAGVRGDVDVRDGQSRSLEPRIVQNAGTVFRWIVGARFDWSERVRIGAAYRQSFGVPLDIGTTADIAGTSLSVDITKAEALFDPATVVVGVRVLPVEGVALELDAAYHNWSRWEGPALGISTTASAMVLTSRASEGMFTDTMSARLAAAWTVGKNSVREVSLHVGSGYETTMLDGSKRQGETNHIDGAKLIFGLGVAMRFPGLVGEAFRVGLGAQLHHVARMQNDKITCTALPCPVGTVAGTDATDPSAGVSNPGYPSLEGGGSIIVGAIGIGVDL